MDKISIGCIMIFIAVFGALLSLGNGIWLGFFGLIFLIASIMIYLGVRGGEYPHTGRRLYGRKAR